MVFNGEPSESCIFEQVFLAALSLVVTLTFDLLTSNSSQFIFVPKCA